MAKFQDPLSAAAWDRIQDSLWKLSGAVAELAKAMQSENGVVDSQELGRVDGIW